MRKSTDTDAVRLPLSPLAAELGRFTLELKTRLEQAGTQHDQSRYRYGYRIGHICLVLGRQEPAEIIPAVPACDIPYTPGWFRGMLNVRGNLLPVFDLGQLLEDNNPAETPWLIILGQEERQAALSISTLPVSIELDDPVQTLPEVVPELLRPHLRATYNDGHDLWLEPDYEALFTALRDRF